MKNYFSLNIIRDRGIEKKIIFNATNYLLFNEIFFFYYNL